MDSCIPTAAPTGQRDEDSETRKNIGQRETRRDSAASSLPLRRTAPGFLLGQSQPRAPVRLIQLGVLEPRLESQEWLLHKPIGSDSYHES